MNAEDKHLYSQQLGFRQGAGEADEGVYTEYTTEVDAASNAAENSSATSILRPLTRTELVDTLIIQLNLEKHDAEQFVTYFFKELVLAFLQGESVHLSGFGNFDLIDKKARLGRNPKTGKQHIIGSRRVITFRASKKKSKRSSERLS